MGIDIRLPNITATTERGQLEQIRSYLYQFAEQLKYAVQVIDINTIDAAQQVKTVTNTVNNPTPEQKVQQFNNLKNLIISSADIVNAYSEEISYRLSGSYVAQSEFGTFKEETKKQVEDNSEALTAYYEKLQTVEQWQLQTSAYIKTGYLADIDNLPVYGVEIYQQTNDVEGNIQLQGMVRFTPTKTIFYDGYGEQMGVMSNSELIIEGIVCRGNIYLNGFVLSVSPVHGFSIKPSGRKI